ncbi:hypothetical protein RD792_015633 [Penstemon davidsonii]|uniref:U-box domain-containing protein n=1 Tax=Penstemon davidsonii TaxID=160366 RepID=A0ABR0CH95_9LAMI|nr:hypothetical protein RD792_015633 [Penstemon davidsonii]
MEMDRDPCMDCPQDFRCPISMELMKDPVIISTGVTYDRINIEKWFLTYEKRSCPATMQPIESLDMTPNHTLKRLIITWLDSHVDRNLSSIPTPSGKHDELVTILGNIESSPFKVSSLRKLRCILGMGDEVKKDFKRLKGVEVIVRIIVQILVESTDFAATFTACEEALGVLDQVTFSDEDEEIIQILMKPDCMKAIGLMLQRGSADARFCSVSIFQKMAKPDHSHTCEWNFITEDLGIDFFKSLLEIISDEMCSTKASSCALNLLLQILNTSKKSRIKAIEAGGICTLIELLPDSNRPRCEKIMELIKCLCECADGRLAFTEHGLGIAAVSKKMLNVSNGATKIGVKILWLISSFNPTERVLEEMLGCGAVKKLVALLHIGGQSTTKERVVKILKLHGRMWKRYPNCFPSGLKDYLGLAN